MFGFGPQMVGGMFGLGLGMLSFITLHMVAGRMTNPAQARPASMLKSVALVELIAFPVLGYILGPIVLG
ncbi:MAG: hypothetical protein ACFCUN_11550 [Hyphomicrobiaceae bacterium]